MNTPTSNETPLRPLSSEQIAHRKVVRNSTNLNSVSDHMRLLENALDDIHREAGELPAEVRIERPAFGSDKVTKQVSWKNRQFGEVSLAISLGSIGDATCVDRFTTAVPVVPLNGSVVTFQVSQKLQSGIRLLRAQNGPIVELTGAETDTFSVPVRWINGPNGKQIPHTASKTDDDFDFVLMDREGCFMVIEMSLTTRRGAFFLAFQLAYAGQVVRTTKAGAERAGLDTVAVGDQLGSIVPLFAENAYPGASLFKSMSYLASGIVAAALKGGNSVPLSKCYVARWVPNFPDVPEKMREEGWQSATVMWFNAAGGYGSLYCQDGNTCFAHFKSIENAGGQPVWKNSMFPNLTPMRGVLVKYVPGPKGRQATAVRML